jgi:polysaccharide export outer membrane protein
MRFLIYFFLLFSIVSIFSSCSNKQYQTLFEKRTAIADSSAQKPAVTLDSYLIQPQDVLQIRQLQNINFIVDQASTSGSNSGTSGTTSAQGQTYQVEEDGTVALPDIGHVPVVGLTRILAQKKVEKLYVDSGVQNPIIELKIINLKVTILGEVKSQGNYPLVKDKTTLVELIGEAGGLTDKANDVNVKIIRGNEQNPQVITANLSDISSINAPGNVLQNGDIIYVAENKRAAQGDNLLNFTTVFSPFILILNTALIIFTLARK